jgi:hypothetical protein
VAAIRRITAAAVGCLAIAVPVCSAVPAAASTGSGPQYAVQLAEAQQAAQLAAAQGYRTGVAVLDLATGDYSGAGDDAGLFPSESVAKVLIATELLLTGRMNGADEPLARAMITASDDDAADRLYPQVGGDDVLPRIAAHYGITGLGAPPTTPGWWGLTRISARGLVQLYAALQRDPAVQPWLSDAMAHAAPVAADGTQQLFGLPAAVPGSAIKQGWGHESVSGSQAVANSTGYVAGHLAVAILTQGPPASYLAGITGVVTAQAQALLAGVTPVAAPAPPAAPVATAAPQRDDLRLALASVAGLGALAAAGYGGLFLFRRARAALQARRERTRARLAEQRRRRALAAAARSGATVVRLPDGRLVRLTGRRPAGTRPAAARGSTAATSRAQRLPAAAQVAARAA